MGRSHDIACASCGAFWSPLDFDDCPACCPETAYRDGGRQAALDAIRQGLIQTARDNLSSDPGRGGDLDFPAEIPDALAGRGDGEGRDDVSS